MGQTAIRFLLGHTTICFARQAAGDFPDVHVSDVAIAGRSRGQSAISPLLFTMKAEGAVRMLCAVASERRVVVRIARHRTLLSGADGLQPPRAAVCGRRCDSIVALPVHAAV